MNASLALPRRPSECRRLLTPRPSMALVQDGVVNLRGKRRIRISVRGLQFETFQSTLEQYPDTLLGCPTRRIEFYDPVGKEYCLDRDPAIFDSILFYYQSNGILARPDCVPQSLFNEELEFFGIKTEQDETNRKKCETEISSSNSEALSLMEISSDDNCRRRANKIRNNCWLMMEYPKVSLAGKIWVRISISVILLSVFAFCLETMPELNCAKDVINNTSSRTEQSFITNASAINGNCQLGNCTTPAQAQSCHAALIWFVVETSLVLFFLMEYLIRIFTAPNRCKFVFSLFGMVDAAAIAPYFITVAVHGWRSENYLQVNSFSVLRIIRLFRVVRVFKLSRHSDGLKLVGKTFKVTWRKLLSLTLFVIMAVILSASFLFYAEDTETVNSIFESFYWAVITMTTVGYGDIVPRTIMGKLTASACMITGIVLLLILPLPVFVTHFSSLYEEHVSKKKREQGKLRFESPTLLEKLMLRQ